MLELLLVTQKDSGITQMLIWVVGAILLLLLTLLLFWQRKQGRELVSELEQLDKVKKHNIEFEFVLKAMKLSTWYIDAEARTLTFNNDFRDRTDSYVPEPETPLEEIFKKVASRDRERFAKAVEDLCSGRIEYLHEIFQVKSPHTKKNYWSETYATVAARNTEGLPKSIVGTSTRVDERKAMEVALVEARNKAEESDRLKSAFIANMSHEIRTPLNAIIGFTCVLPDVQSDEERKGLIDLIQENNQKLLQIIDDVMNISKIESGKEKLVMSTFELNDVLRNVVDTYMPQVKGGVNISTMFAQGMLNVTTDLGRLMEILNHLMSNAVKFTSEGNIILGYDAPADKRIRIWVRDTGKGIGPEHLERVFERFFKVDEYIPGAGLGLSICRTMAYSMGGDVGVASKLGEGSKFWLEIPV
jgi:signal transduction histidine kinase